MEKSSRKLNVIKNFIADKGKNGVVIAFSGGVDSVTLAAISHQVLGEKAVAVIAQSPIHPNEELRYAEQAAKEIGIHLYTIQTEELKNLDFIKNSENRCYFCKKNLLSKLLLFAQTRGFEAVFEGTNFSDLNEHRPGFRAIQEVDHAYSPWVDCKFTKDEIQQIAKGLNLNVKNKPPTACLASRIQFNQIITLEKIRRIEQAEQIIKKLVKSHQIRVRDHNGLARIEVESSQRKIFYDVKILDKVVLELKNLGFRYVTFDLEGYRRGSMLKTIGASSKEPL